MAGANEIIEKVVTLDKDTNLDEIEEFFADSESEEAEGEEVDGNEEVTMEKFKDDVRDEREKYQPTASEKIFAVVKSIILRALAFYAILWLLRRSPARPPAASVPAPAEDLEEEEFLSGVQQEEL